jgi:phage terminase large subunit
MIRRRWNYPGTKGICMAPDYNRLSGGTLESLLDLINPDTILSYDRSPPQNLIFVNGSSIRAYTASDPNMTRSLQTNDVWIDEGPYCPYQSYRVVLGSMRLPEPKGMVNSLWITGTPNGYDWTYGVFGEDGKEGFKVFHTTIYENPHLTRRYVKAMEDEYKGTDFEQQELMGNYTLWEGLVYPQFNDGNMWVGEQDFEIGVGGIDLGDISPSVLVPLGVHNNQLWVPEEFYGRRVATTDLLGHMADMERRYKIAAWFCETTAEYFIRSTRAAGFDVRPCPVKDVESGVRVVQQYFRDNLVHINPERCPNGVRELRTYQRKAQNLGDSFADTLVKANDHYPDALRYGIVGYENTYIATGEKRTQETADDLFAWGVPVLVTESRFRRGQRQKQEIGQWA